MFVFCKPLDDVKEHRLQLQLLNCKFWKDKSQRGSEHSSRKDAQKTTMPCQNLQPEQISYSESPNGFVSKEAIFIGNNGQRFVIKEIESKEEKRAAIEFMRANWAQIHTVTQHFGLDADKSTQIWQAAFERSFKFPVSLIAFDQRGQVAGIKLNSIYEGQMLPDVTFDKVDPRILELDEKKEQGELWTDSEVLEAMQRHLPHIADVGVKFISFYALLWKDIVRTHMPDCRRMLKFENLAINPEHTRQGLAQLLVRRSLELGRQFGCDYAATSASSIGSQCVQRKCGLVCARRINYLDIDDPIFRKWEGNSSTGCEIYCIKLC